MENISAQKEKLEENVTVTLQEPMTLSTQALNSLRETVMNAINAHPKEEGEKVMQPTTTVAPKDSARKSVLGKRNRR